MGRRDPALHERSGPLFWRQCEHGCTLYRGPRAVRQRAPGARGPSRRRSAPRSPPAVLALGVAVLLLIRAIPVVGAIVFTLILVIGLGAIIRTRLGATPKDSSVPV
jgi:hypothetical protein